MTSTLKCEKCDVARQGGPDLGSEFGVECRTRSEGQKPSLHRFQRDRILAWLGSVMTVLAHWRVEHVRIGPTLGSDHAASDWVRSLKCARVPLYKRSDSHARK